MTSTKRRLIDTWPASPRTKAMRVIVLSPARSGTTSTEYALKALGYNVYCGMKHAFLNAKTENCYPHCSEAIDAKYNGSGLQLYGSKDFEKILGKYDAVVGWPASCFVDEMLEAYPDAKIILMKRDVDKWVGSMQKSLVTRLSWPSWRILLPLENGLVRDCITCGQKCLAVWTDGQFWDGKALARHFEEHNTYVKKIVPADRLLEFDVKDGWGPLCEFLGVEVPFPREADGRSFEKQGRFFWMLAVAKATVRVSVFGGPLMGASLLALRWYRRRIR